MSPFTYLLTVISFLDIQGENMKLLIHLLNLREKLSRRKKVEYLK